MTTAASWLILTVTDALQDASAVTWKTAELVRYLNDGQRAILQDRPDALAATASMALAAGAKQTLPTAGAKLLDIRRNTSGNQRAVTLVEDRAVLDVAAPGWHTGSGATEILHFLFDPRDPRVFYVYPAAASSGASLEVVYAAHPTDITEPGPTAVAADVSGNISVRDIFANALRNYILWRAWSKESDVAPNAARAAAHLEQYRTELGLEVKGTLAAAPRRS